MSRPVAVTHAPEGAGNAIRMLAIAKELRERDVDVTMAGGGPGSMFVRMNGFEEFEPADIDFIHRREEDGLLAAVPSAAVSVVCRFRDLYGWIGREDPAYLVTDDPLAMVAAWLCGVNFSRVEHSRPSYFDGWLERWLHRLGNWLSLRLGDVFYLTTLWKDDIDVPGVMPVDPLVVEPDGEQEVGSFDVLIVPGTYSTGFDAIAEELREAGLSVCMVGGEGWEAVPAMLPYMEEADAVLCTGFSSIAEAAVAGTYCVVFPFIDCQKGVAAAIEEYDVAGIDVVRSVEDAVSCLKDPGPAPSYVNGAPDVAGDIIDRLE